MITIKSKKQIIICCAVIIVSICAVILYWSVFYKMLFPDKEEPEMIGPGAVQIIEVRIISISDNEIVCTTDKEIKGVYELGFRHFDKGADIVIKPREGEGDFAGMKYQAGDHISLHVFGCEDENGKSIITADKTQIHKVKKQCKLFVNSIYKRLLL